MDYLKAQYPPKLIREKLGLNDEQLHSALAYIETHRTEAETEYQECLKTAAEIRQYWEERNRERLATIADLEVRGRGMFIMVAIRRQDETLLTHPKPGVRVLAGDTIVALGHRGDIPQFARSQVQKRQIRYRGAEG